MGTNYYWTSALGDEIHIGKSSVGWCFTLHVVPERGITDLKQWTRLFREPGSCIKDEYQRPVTAEEMLEEITLRMGRITKDAQPPDGQTWGQFHDKNFSQFGPNGLLRFRISDRCHCIGHGDGTWDLLTGEFS